MKHIISNISEITNENSNNKKIQIYNFHNETIY